MHAKEIAVSRRKKRRIAQEMDRAREGSLANRAASLGLPIDQPPAQPQAAASTCLDASVLNNPAIVAEIAHALSCRKCAAMVEVRHEMNEDRKNPLTLDFRPSAEWVRKNTEALMSEGLPVEAEKYMDQFRVRCGAEVAKYIASRAYTARSSQAPSFVLVKDGEFLKDPFRARLEGGLLIPSTDKGKEVLRILVQEFIAWLKECGGDLEVGHRVVERLVVDGDSVMGYVKLEPAIPWPLFPFPPINCS